MKIAEIKPDASAPIGDFQAWMGGVQSRIESALARLLPAVQVRPTRLHEAMRYATLEGGKRVRPLLVFAAGEATGKTLTVPELEAMHIHKTGALIRASVLLGAYCGKNLNENQIALLDRYAKSIGLAFQVVDDVLDCESSTATLGKTAGKDQKQGKPTYVSAMGLAAARQFAQDLRGKAHAALEGLGTAGRRLGELADFIVLRKF